MKLQVLMMAVALVGGTAFAQAPYGSARAPADMPAGNAATMSSPRDGATGTRAASSDVDRATKHGDKSHAKVDKKHHAAHHASAKQHHPHHVASTHHHPKSVAAADHHSKHADAAAHGKVHHDARMMGAVAASPATSLEASTRQERMDRAYADWQARR